MTAPDFPPAFLEALDRAVRDRDGTPERGELRFRCPAVGHPDAHPSARWNRTKAVWRCDVCGATGGALDLARRLGIELPKRLGEGARRAYPSQPHRNTATLRDTDEQSGKPSVEDNDPPGCTIAAYASAKRLDPATLRGFGLSDAFYAGGPAVRICYPDQNGRDLAIQFRVRLTKGVAGEDRFKWKSGSKTCLYGLNRLAGARESGYAALVEGASDCHTLWAHDEPALGLPGANGWKESRDAELLDGIATIYAVIEPDQGGETIAAWIAKSRIRDRVKVLDLGGHKDPSALYLDDPERFRERWAAALAAAAPFQDRAEAAARERAKTAWVVCATLAREPDILTCVADVLEASGVAGEARVLKLIYLAVVSRFLVRPVSLAVKGPSSGGKSYAVERVLDFFPSEAFYALTAMSERALAYDDEPLVHRILVIYEAAGLAGDIASYLMRSLLSEGCVRYLTVEKTKDGMRPRLIERAGPTGLIVTTTAVHLHKENETRMLSLTVDDSPGQTRRILRALAAGTVERPDMSTWHALHVWLAGAEHRVAIPFAELLAELSSAAAVRLRRDFGVVLNLIRAHAILHQAIRSRDLDGRIVATIQADYAAVRVLVADLLAEGVEATVPASVRETVTTVGNLLALGGHDRRADDDESSVSLSVLAKALRLDKSAASRRVRVAIDREYLKNLETRRGRPARIAIGDALPHDEAVLPSVAEVMERCTVAVKTEGEKSPSPAVSGTGDVEYVEYVA